MASDHPLLGPKSAVVLGTRFGESVAIYNSGHFKLATLAESGLVDCVIADAEDGFSPLGMLRSYLSEDLGISERNLVQLVLDGFPEILERNISSLADWSRFRRDEVTLVAIPSERQNGHLRGLVLTPYDDSLCYKKFASPEYGAHPNRDFMYNVTYEAIVHAYKHWGARRIGMSHFARYGFHRDTTTCQVEAIAHFCNDHKGMESFTFMDQAWGDVALEVVNEFNQMQDIGIHRQIKTYSLQHWGIDFIDLEWPHELKQAGVVPVASEK